MSMAIPTPMIVTMGTGGVLQRMPEQDCPGLETLGVGGANIIFSKNFEEAGAW